MPQLIWSVLCYKGCLDSYSNQVSLLDVIEGLSIKTNQLQDPLRVPVQMSLVSLWLRSEPGVPETFEARANLVMPDGSELPGLVTNADLQTHSRLRTFMRIEGLEFRGPGLYWLAVEHRPAADSEWIRGGKVPLDVQIERVERATPESPARPPQPASPRHPAIRRRRARR